MEFARDLDVIAEPDVLVAGLGCAGLGAALAAGRAGLKTLAVETSGFAGGYITNVMGPTLDGAFDVVTGERVVGGIVTEILTEVAGIAPHELDGHFTNGGQVPRGNVDIGKPPVAANKRGVSLNLETFKRFADMQLQAAGVSVLFHARNSAVIRENNRITGVVVASKGGLGIVRPRYVIDATGDADLAHWAGAPTVKSRVQQPMTLHFRLGNVEISNTMLERATSALAEAAAEGRISGYGGPWILQVGPRDISINATRISADRTDPWQWSQAEVTGREIAWKMFEIWKAAVPEFRDSYYVTSGPEVGARETRQIVGLATLTADDIRERRSYADAVLQGAWYLDRHPATTGGFHAHGLVRPYDIRYGTLVPQELENTLVVGRCHSATSEALASSRVTATAMAMGQAAGMAVAMDIERNSPHLATLDAAALRTGLVNAKVMLA